MRTILLSAALFQSFAVFGAVQEGQRPAAPPAEMQTLNVNDLKQFDPKLALEKTPLETAKLVFKTFFLKPRQLLRFHRHQSSDEIYYFIDGKGQATVGDRQTLVVKGSVVTAPEGVNHGVVNTGDSDMVVVSVTGPKPVKDQVAENSTIFCKICSQELIIPENAKEGDIVVCPRCKARLRLIKTPEGKWSAVKA